MQNEAQLAAEAAAEASIEVVSTDTPAESPASDPTPTDPTTVTPAQGARSEEPETPDQGEDGDEAADDHGDDAAAKRPPGRAEKRIDKLTRKLRDAERREAARLAEAAYWKGVAEGRGGKAQAGQGDAAAAQAAADPKPAADDYDTVEEFADALADWKARQPAAPKAGAASQEPERRAPASSEAPALPPEAEAKWSKSLRSATESIPDFAEVVTDEDVPISKEIVLAACEEDDPARIIYELAKDPENVRRIAKLSPQQQAREVWRFADQLAAKGATSEPSNARGRDGAQDAGQPQTRQQPRVDSTRAAPVPRHLDGGAGLSTVDESKMSDAEWLELERRRDRDAGRRPW